jgi:hypothetical protein
MPILDPAFREQLRGKRAKPSALKVVTVGDSLTRDAAIDRSADRPVSSRIWTASEMEPPVTVGDDPDDSIDPDDDLSKTDAIPPLPEMPGNWWARMVCGAENESVTSLDAESVFKHIERRLMVQQTAQTPSARPQDGSIARLPSSEGGSSAPILPLDGIAFSEVISRATTIGQLHEAIAEHYGEAGWETLVRLWQEQTGITQPARVHANITNRTPEQKVTAGLPVPSSSSSQESEAKAISSLPLRVARFWLREPLAPPAWRRQENEAEGQWREDREADGAWCG